MIVRSFISARLPEDTVLQHEVWAVNRKIHILKSRYRYSYILSNAFKSISCFLLWNINNRLAAPGTEVWYSANDVLRATAFLIHNLNI